MLAVKTMRVVGIRDAGLLKETPESDEPTPHVVLDLIVPTPPVPGMQSTPGSVGHTLIVPIDDAPAYNATIQVSYEVQS